MVFTSKCRRRCVLGKKQLWAQPLISPQPPPCISRDHFPPTARCVWGGRAEPPAVPSTTLPAPPLHNVSTQRPALATNQSSPPTTMQMTTAATTTTVRSWGRSPTTSSATHSDRVTCEDDDEPSVVSRTCRTVAKREAVS